MSYVPVSDTSVGAPGPQCAMLLWSYFTCVAADPGRVPPRWSPFADDVEAAQVLAALEQGSLDAWPRDDVSRPRYCKKCQARDTCDPTIPRHEKCGATPETSRRDELQYVLV